MSFAQHTVGRDIPFQGDVTDVFGKKLLRAGQKRIRHATAVLETSAGKFLDQFAKMVNNRVVLGTEKRDLPLMAKAEPQDQFVNPFGLSRAGRTGADQEAAPFVSANLIHLLPARIRSGSEAVLVEGAKLTMQVGRGKDAFQRDFRRLFDGDAKAVAAISDNLIDYFNT